ncbi:MAG: MAC/perforin domain-containing protein [Polyangiaceae bacterium]
MSETLVLPGLETCMRNGYNALRASFLGAPVFVLTYDNPANVLEYGPSDDRTVYRYPDSTSVSSEPFTSNSSTTEIFESSSNYDDYFSASVQGSMSYMSYSASASSSIAFHGSMFSSKSNYYAVNFGMEQVYSAKRIDVGTLEADFTAALAALPASAETEAEIEAYFDFFERYGTHYLVTGGFGGYYTMQTTISESTMEKSSSVDAAASISVGFQSVTSSGSLDASVAYGNSSFLSDSETVSTVTFYTNGGTYNTDIQAYFSSVYSAPILLLNLTGATPVVVSPLSDLIPADSADRDARVAAFNTALTAYVAEDDGDLSMLSPPEGQQISTNFVASHDGFVLATILEVNDGDRGKFICQAGPQSSTSNVPSTLVGACSIYAYDKKDMHVPASGVTFPVRAGYKWNATFTPGSGKPDTAVGFVSLNLPPGVSLGPSQTMQIGAVPITLASDGFLVGVVNCTGNNSRANLAVALREGIFAECSAHYDKDDDEWVSCASVCLPVQAGESASFYTSALSGTPTFSTFFVPIQGATGVVGAMMQTAYNQIIQAETDGFLVALLVETASGDKATVSVFVASDPSDLADTDGYRPRLATSIDYDTGENRRIQYNTITVPIAKGEWYKVDLQKTGKPQLQIRWIPILEPVVAAAAE